MYPFLSLRYASGDLAQVIREEGVFLGCLISGGLNHESDETMRSYVSQNVSRRNYEGLFLQSSKAIGVYTRGAEPNSDADLDLYEKHCFAPFRSAKWVFSNKECCEPLKPDPTTTPKKSGSYRDLSWSSAGGRSCLSWSMK
jgi:hypothetical protein